MKAITRLEKIIEGEDLEPITRLEKIIEGEDLEPITRLEWFLKNYGGGGTGTGGGGSNKLPSLVDRSITEITAEDLEGATKIADSAFYGCSSLVSLEIPDTVEEIGSSATMSCTYLTRVVVGRGVKRMKDMAFGCGTPPNPTTYVFLGTTPPAITSYSMFPELVRVIIVPKGCGEAYKSATNWANLAELIVEEEE